MVNISRKITGHFRKLTQISGTAGDGETVRHVCSFPNKPQILLNRWMGDMVGEIEATGTTSYTHCFRTRH